MRISQENRNIFLAALGILFVLFYLGVVDRSKFVHFLQFEQPKETIIARAENVYNASPLARYDLSRNTKLLLDEQLLQYAQRNLTSDTSQASLPIGKWQIAWRGNISTKEVEKQEVRFTLTYDLNGNLIELEQYAPQLIRLPNLKETEAIQKAKLYLASMNVDTSATELTDRRLTKENDILNYEFVFDTGFSDFPELRKSIEVGISGQEVTRFEAATKLASGQTLKSNVEKSTEIAAYAVMILVWLLIAIFLVFTFFKRLKHDELEFRRAIFIGGVVALLMWVIVAFESEFDFEAMLLGGVLAGLVVGAAALVSYAVNESLNRDVWQHKLTSLDILFRGQMRFQEMGAAILNAIFIAGFAFLNFAIIIWIFDRLNLGYLTLDRDILWIFQDWPALFPIVAGNFVVTLFVAVVLFSYWATYLRSKIGTKTVLIGLLALFINFAGLHFILLRPDYLSFILLVPLAVFLAHAIMKYDLLTLLFSLLLFFNILDFSLVGLLPDGFLSTPGITTGVLILALFSTGVYFSFSRVSTHHFESYVPEYISRIAERERFLKELEIARSVQTRFLPQSIPQLPDLAIACICRPAMEVGGDYYDFIQDEDRLSIVIGDVSGKGVSAAFYMTMVKGIIKTLARTIKEPKRLLTEMNAIFYENVPRDVFVSVIYGTFDLKSRVLTFARAGHNPVIVQKKLARQTEMLNPRGLAIGLEKGKLFSTTIEEKTMHMDPEDVFVFYTDGISESMNHNGEEFGEERLRAIINNNSSQSAQGLLDKITEDVNRFAGNTNQHDDFTMVVIKVSSRTDSPREQAIEQLAKDKA